MSTTRIARLGAATILVMGVACGGGAPPPEEPAETAGYEAPPPPPPPPPPRPSPVRIIHAAAGASEQSASAVAGPDDSPLARVDEVSYRAASEYVDVAPGVEQAMVPVQIQVGGASSSFEAPMQAGVPATVLLMSNPQDASQLLVVPTQDDPTAVTGQIRGRFVNALLGAEAVDFCVPGDRREPGRAIFTGVRYGQLAGTETPNRYFPLQLDRGMRLQIRQSGSSPCAGRSIGTAEIPPPDASVPHNYTVVVVGRAAGRPAVARELLICEDAPNPSACVALPLR